MTQSQKDGTSSPHRVAPATPATPAVGEVSPTQNLYNSNVNANDQNVSSGFDNNVAINIRESSNKVDIMQMFADNMDEATEENSSKTSSTGSGFDDTPKQTRLLHVDESVSRTFRQVRYMSYLCLLVVLGVTIFFCVMTIQELNKVSTWLDAYSITSDAFNLIPLTCGMVLRATGGVERMYKSFFEPAAELMLPMIDTIVARNEANNGLPNLDMDFDECKAAMLKIPTRASYCQTGYRSWDPNQKKGENMYAYLDSDVGTVERLYFTDNPQEHGTDDPFNFFSWWTFVEQMAARKETTPSNLVPKNMFVLRKDTDAPNVSYTAYPLFYKNPTGENEVVPPFQGVLIMFSKLEDKNDVYTFIYHQNLPTSIDMLREQSSTFQNRIMQLKITPLVDLLNENLFYFSTFYENGEIRKTQMNYNEAITTLATHMSNIYTTMAASWTYPQIQVTNSFKTTTDFCGSDNVNKSSDILHAFLSHLQGVVDNSKLVVSMCALAACLSCVIGGFVTIKLVRSFLPEFDRIDGVPPSLAVMTCFPKAELRRISRNFQVLRTDRGIFNPDDEGSGLCDLKLTRRQQKQQETMMKLRLQLLANAERVPSFDEPRPSSSRKSSSRRQTTSENFVITPPTNMRGLTSKLNDEMYHPPCTGEFSNLGGLRNDTPSKQNSQRLASQTSTQMRSFPPSVPSEHKLDNVRDFQVNDVASQEVKGLLEDVQKKSEPFLYSFPKEEKVIQESSENILVHPHDDSDDDDDDEMIKDASDLNPTTNLLLSSKGQSNLKVRVAISTSQQFNQPRHEQDVFNNSPKSPNNNNPQRLGLPKSSMKQSQPLSNGLLSAVSTLTNGQNTPSIDNIHNAKQVHNNKTSFASMAASVDNAVIQTHDSFLANNNFPFNSSQNNGDHNLGLENIDDSTDRDDFLNIHSRDNDDHLKIEPPSDGYFPSDDLPSPLTYERGATVKASHSVSGAAGNSKSKGFQRGKKRSPQIPSKNSSVSSEDSVELNHVNRNTKHHGKKKELGIAARATEVIVDEETLTTGTSTTNRSDIGGFRRTLLRIFTFNGLLLRPLSASFCGIWFVAIIYVLIALLFSFEAVGRYKVVYNDIGSLMETSFHMSICTLFAFHLKAGETQNTYRLTPYSKFVDWYSYSVVNAKTSFLGVLDGVVGDTSVARSYGPRSVLLFENSCLSEYKHISCDPDQRTYLQRYDNQETMQYGLMRSFLYWIQQADDHISKYSGGVVHLMDSSDSSTWFLFDALKVDLQSGMTHLRDTFSEEAAHQVQQDTTVQWFFLGGACVLFVVLAVCFEWIIRRQRSHFIDVMLVLKLMPGRLLDDYRIIDKVLTVQDSNSLDNNN
eukprot:GDKJ01044064.1.p1 GENE.GDKJ01044064.1~~GDKJ01044064.1.p1  ORF type:complete len:1481 (+),score=328.99 GDKJ01044064.1:420-4445(+)